MSTSTEECHIAKVTQDAIASLSTFLTAQEVARLWLCGDSRLNKLLQRAPIELDFTFTPGDSYPKLLSEFSNTQVLRVRCDGYSFAMHVVEIMNGGLPLHLLPKSIRILELDFLNDYTSLVRYSSQSKGSPKTLELVDLKEVLPNVQRITCRGQHDVSVIPLVRGRSELPDSFSDLEMHVTPPTITNAQDLAEFPKFCSSLSLSDYIGSSLELPSQLRFLSLSHCKVPVTTLPPNLESLFWTFDYADKPTMLTPDFLKVLPSTLTELSITYFHSVQGDIWEQLPSKLEKLQLDSIQKQTWDEVKPNLKHLESLKSLVLAIFDDPVPWENVLPNLPKSIEHLNVGQETPPKHWKLLPKNIKSLEVYEPYNEDDDIDAQAMTVLGDSKVPLSLECLVWPFSSSVINRSLAHLTVLEVAAVSGNLPFPSLTSLKTREFTANPVDILSEAPFKLLSFTARRLTLQQIPLIDFTWPSLNSVTIAKLECHPGDATPSDASVLPVGLAESHLQVLDLFINFQSQEYRVPAKLLKSLPKSLQYLVARPMEKLEPADFESLPPHLLQLQLQGTPNNQLKESQLYKVLPKTLQDVSVPGYSLKVDTDKANKHFHFLNFDGDQSRIFNDNSVFLPSSN